MTESKSPDKPRRSGDDKVGTPDHTQRDEAIKQRHREGKSLSELSREFRLSKAQISRIVKGVNSKGHRTGGNTSKGGGNGGEDTTIFGIHSYAIKVPIQSKPIGWSANVIMYKKKVNFRLKGKLRNSKVYVFPFARAGVHLTTKNVIIYIEETSPISAEHVQLRATQVAQSLIPRLERLLELRLSYTHRMVFIDIASQHAVMINPKVYDILKQAGFKEVRDEKGRRILYLDNSKGQKHIESDDKVRATEYIDNFSTAVKEYCRGAMTPKKVEQTLSEILKIQKETNRELRVASKQITNISTSIQCVLNLISPNQTTPKHRRDEFDRPPSYIG